MIIYFVATRPYIEKALGNMISYTYSDARDMLTDLGVERSGFNIYRATVVDIEKAFGEIEAAQEGVE